MMRTLLLTFLVLIQFGVFAQQRLTVKTNPLYLLENNRYTMPLDMEYAFGKFSVQAGQMLMVSKATGLGLRENLNYSKTNLQLRYYLDGMFSGGSLGFIGLHGTTRNYDYLSKRGSYISGGGRNVNYLNSIVETQNFGAYAISGVQIQSKSNIIFEFVMGFGMREVSIQHNPEEITFVDSLDPFLFDDFEPEWREGARTIPGILIQMRFGYVFIGNKKKDK
ncbi:MAG: DUF3575 domain-containing protein [Cytophagales bacterium]|nr:DUF3575 domain-containing protein [Cytophagales bacterium]